MAALTQTPDFILDLGADRTIVPLPWTIRKWSDVEEEVKRSGGYGIISYSWGKWHDKSQYVLGGTVGNVNANGYPTFNIGVSTKDSVNGADMHLAATKTTEQFITKTGRKIPKGTPLSWMFPKVCFFDANGEIKDHDTEVFTIAEIKNALIQIGKRFVWWDWACIPQGWDWDPRPRILNQPGPPTVGVERPARFRVHDDLKDAATSSMNKMRHFYPASSVGCMWWHETRWTSGVAPGPVERAVEVIKAINTTKNLTPAMLNILVESVTSAARTESSLVSLWSFQEAVLFSSTARPVVAPATTDAHGHGIPSVILDRSGSPYSVHANDELNRIFFQHGELNLEDITNVVMFMANVIASSLLRYDSISAPDTQSPLVQWCLNPANENAARGLLAQLIKTGLVGLRFNHPLLLLEARFGREIRATARAMDVSVNTIMGAVSVDLTAERARADKTNAAIVPPLSSREEETILLPIMTRAFLEGLFKMYQWRMFLFARDMTFVPQALKTIWDTLIGTKRSQTASLTPYFDPDGPLAMSYGPSGKPGGKHTDVIDLPKLVLDIAQSLVICVIEANYALYDYATIGIAPAPAPRGWTQCVLYEYAATDPAWLPAYAQLPAPAPPAAGAPAVAPPILPGTVRAVSVPFAQRTALMGPEVVLFPFQRAVETPAIFVTNTESKNNNWLRCFVMIRNNPARPDALTYRGVCDLYGMNDGTIRPTKMFTIA